jgi:hypothetical protein
MEPRFAEHDILLGKGYTSFYLMLNETAAKKVVLVDDRFHQVHCYFNGYERVYDEEVNLEIGKYKELGFKGFRAKFVLKAIDFLTPILYKRLLEASNWSNASNHAVYIRPRQESRAYFPIMPFNIPLIPRHEVFYNGQVLEEVEVLSDELYNNPYDWWNQLSEDPDSWISGYSGDDFYGI